MSLRSEAGARKRSFGVRILFDPSIQYRRVFFLAMSKVLTATLLALILAVLPVREAYAQEIASGSSASLKTLDVKPGNDYRVTALKRYLDKNGSPLADYAQVFVDYADKYNIDYRLVPAISGVESTFGKQIPINSFNAYGWAGGEYRFASWEDSIMEVTKTLKSNYIEKGAVTIDQIARIYCPPSSTWAGKVKYFVGKIDPLPLNYDL